MIIPNMIDVKKTDKRIFFLRIFSSEPIDVTEMPETQEIAIEGTWGEVNSGARRKLENKNNPSWCKNP